MGELQNGLRTFRPDLDHYVFSSDAIKDQILAWIDGVVSKKASRALLITGPTGLGKTTLALAACQKLNASERDIKEINCADLRTLDDAREQIYHLDFKPMEGNYRVLILDECHQMVPNAQTAFLTPIEKLSEQVLIIGCTSNPEKLTPAFRNRFYEIKIQDYTPDAIVDILLQLPIEPKIKPPVAVSIATHCGGNPRKAIAMVEQNILGQQGSTEALVQSLKQDEANIQAFFQSIFDWDAKKLLLISKMIKEDSSRKLFFDKILMYFESFWMVIHGLQPAIMPRELDMMKIIMGNYQDKMKLLKLVGDSYEDFLVLSEKPWPYLKAWIMRR
jgi:DNA polymerase III gamma/tau subunit